MTNIIWQTGLVRVFSVTIDVCVGFVMSVVSAVENKLSKATLGQDT